MTKPQIHEREFGVNPDGSDRYACAGDGVCGFGPTADDAFGDWGRKLKIKQYDEARGGGVAKQLSDIEQIEKIMIDKGWRHPGQTDPPLPEAVGLMIDLIENLQGSQSNLRQRLYNEAGIVT